MLRRLFWVAVGVGMGLGIAFWFVRLVRQTAARYSPDRIGSDLAGAVRSVGTDLRAAVEEGRHTMRQREAELRDRLEGPAR